MDSLCIIEMIAFLEANEKVLGLMINFFIGLLLIVIAYQANKIAKNQNNLAARQIYLSVYDMITEALGHVKRDGAVKDPAKDLFWQARDRARLELPKPLELYTQELFDLMWHAYKLYYHKLFGDDRLPVGEERNAVSREHEDIIIKLNKEHPHKVFEKYMRIKV